MKTQISRKVRRFQLQVMAYGNSYYIERIAQLERLLARVPHAVQLDLIGVGEIPADFALTIRSALRARRPRTQIIANACSSLHGASVLVWLLGDRRMIRDDAKVFFRKANVSDPDDDEQEPWKEKEFSIWDLSSDLDPEEGDYVRVLELIDEFLPVKELAGRLISVPELRHFGLIDNERIDRFLATALRKQRAVRPSRARQTDSMNEETRNAEQPSHHDNTLDFMI